MEKILNYINGEWIEPDDIELFGCGESGYRIGHCPNSALRQS